MIEPANEQIQELLHKIKKDEAVHFSLPGGSMLHIDRPVPFLCLYRYPAQVEKAPEASLLTTQPAYFLLREKDAHLAAELLEYLARMFGKRFGAFLLLELWPGAEDDKVEVYGLDGDSRQFIHLLKQELQQLPYPQIRELKIHSNFPEAHIPLIAQVEEEKHNLLAVGIRIPQFYIDRLSGALYPIMFRHYRQEFSTLLRKCFYDFVRLQTRYEVAHYHSLGRYKEGPRVWEIDLELVEIGSSFDLLLLSSVLNHEEAWQQFKKHHFKQAPTFQYRLIPVDPELLKRRLYNIKIEEVEDPTLAYIFRDKRNELDRMLNMLLERNTPAFKLSSIQVFGGVEEELLQAAKLILNNTIPLDEEAEETYQKGGDQKICAEDFARMARQEIDYLREQHSMVDATVSIRKDITGLMVSRGQLLIGHSYCTTQRRAEALLQHEVGTHVLTYYNGKMQPLRQMYVGTPGYEDLQEGLAVLAEYLVGGLTSARLRTLAGRVMAVDCMLKGGSFPETFQELHKTYDFSARTAYGIVERVFRGGGLTKDAVYLRGLLHLLSYLAMGGKLQPLLIGKVRQDYLPFIDELTHRNILKPAQILPRYFERRECMERLKRLRQKTGVLSLID